MKTYVRNALSLNGTLRGQAVRKRELQLLVYSMIFVFHLSIIGTFANGVVHPILHATSLLLAVFVVARILTHRVVDDTMTFCICVAHTINIACFDLIARSAGGSRWPLFVLVIDYLLVMQVDRRRTLSIVIFAMLWIILCMAETAFRFGLFDIPYFTHPQNQRLESWEDYGSCGTLPCKLGFLPTFSTQFNAVFVFLFDFTATRGFAEQAQREQASMQHTINTVQDIATLLARYDVDAVSDILAHPSTISLPEDMISALRALEHNLREYRAYLPSSCIQHESDDTPSAAAHTLSDKAAELSLERNMLKTPQRLGILPMQVSALLLNIKGSLAMLRSDASKFTEIFSELLSATLSAVESRRGSVDVFVGDKVFGSFNTVRPCSSHACSALSAAKAVIGTHGMETVINIAAASGRVHCGDVGCATMRRFGLIGPLLSQLRVLERCGAGISKQVLCTAATFREAECSHQMRLLPRRVVDATPQGNFVAAEVMLAESEGLGDGEGGSGLEWLYAIGERVREWEGYNAAVRAYLAGGSLVSALRIAGEKAEVLQTCVEALKGSLLMM